MAPMPPLGRDRALALVASGTLPIFLGSPHPTVIIVEQDGHFRIRALVIDPAEAETSRAAAFAAQSSWMPEHYYSLGKPTGPIHCEAPTREALLDHMRTMPWPAEW
jgi:hypothetical protein